MTIEEYFKDWMVVINKNLLSKTLKTLLNTPSSLICPSIKDIFKAFELCSYNSCRVIFVGQDPYPQKGVATGILFGNKAGTKKLSPSLETVIESIINPRIYHGPIDFDITLESWARQGILMLNSALTCEVNRVGSHVNLWRPFISDFLHKMSELRTGIIYVLFGKQAQTFTPYIGKYNDIIEVNHPSYYARTQTIMPCVFAEVDRLLKDKYNTSICWYKNFLT